MNKSPPEELRTPTPAEVRQVDRICDRFEEAWRAGNKPRVEDYLSDVEDRVRSYLQHELIQLEQEIARGDGETASAAGGESVRQECSVLSAGRFEILEEIGRGGMGVVYKARQVGLDRLVALKMILAGAYAGEEERTRFRREATSAARLHHPHIVQIYEVGELDGQPYFALEFVEGGTLAHKIAGTSQPPRDSAHLVETLARAVHYAHTQGIVHRDLKPANILLKTVGAVNGDTSQASAADSLPFHLGLATVKIADFGVAKLLDDGTTEIPHIGRTRTGAILGTPSYMAPEQAEGKTKEVGPAADVYALGAILYELVTGRPPFQSASPLETLLLVKEQEPVSPIDLQPKLSRDLNTICLKCLQKEPTRRYTSAHDLAEDLRRFLSGEPIQARPVGAAERLWRWSRRRPLVAALTGTVALLVAVIAIASPIAALQLRHERDLGREKLWQSCLNEARANRLSRQIGHRFKSLDALAEAASIRPALALRNEAIACLALPDLRGGPSWEGNPVGEYGVGFDAELSRYAYLDKNGVAHVCRVDDRSELFRFERPSEFGRMGSPRFSPNGRFLAIGYLSTKEEWCCLWDLHNGDPVLKVRLEFGTRFDFSPDDRRFAFMPPDESLVVYDLDSREPVARLPKDSASRKPAFHPRKPLIATSRESQVEVHNLESGEAVAVLQYPSAIWTLAWHPDGRTLAVSCDDQRIYIDDWTAKEHVAVLESHTGQATHLEFHPRGDLLVSSSSVDDTTRLWDFPSGRQLMTAPEYALTFSADGKRLAYRNGARIGVWEVTLGDECRSLRHAAAPRNLRQDIYKGVWGADFSPDGRLLATASVDGVRLWDVNGPVREVGQLPSGTTDTVLFHPGGTDLVTYSQNGLHRWPIQPEPAASNGIRIGPPQPLDTRRRNPDYYRKCCWTPDGRSLVVMGNAAKGEVNVLPFGKPGESVSLNGTSAVESFAVSPDSQLVATGGLHRGRVTIWDMLAGKPVQDLQASQAGTSGVVVAFGPEGRRLVTSTQGAYQFWEVGTWRLERELARDREESHPGPLAFSPNGAVLAITPSDRLVRLIEPATGQEIATLTAPDPRTITWLCFSPDGSRLAAGTGNQVVQLWDLRLIRNQLAEMGLDWKLPPYPAEPTALAPLRIEVLEQRKRD